MSDEGQEVCQLKCAINAAAFLLPHFLWCYQTKQFFICDDFIEKPNNVVESAQQQHPWGQPPWITIVIIHSKYFPNSDWLKEHA